MKLFSKAAVGGLLWLAFSAFAFGDTLTITGQTENVDDGGQFTAFLGSNTAQTLLVYCVDFQNFTVFNSAYPVNISTPDVTNAASVMNTRYGTTPVADFTFDTGSLPAVQRYVMAAWLITQYNFSSGVTTNDLEIQNALWTLLNASGSTNWPGGDALGTGTYLTQAISWLGSETPAALAQFESGVKIYTDTTIASTSIPGRWTTGYQEMISVSSVPEPGTLAMLGIGLLAIGLVGKRVKA
jgi:hypothetical protein